MTSVFLQNYLEPLKPLLAREDVTDLYVNQPEEVWIETLNGSKECHTLPGLTEAALTRLARQVASLSHQGVSRAHPLLSASLPGGERVQIVAPPATRGPMAMAIRKHNLSDMSLTDYISLGAFEKTRVGGQERAERLNALSAQLDSGDIAGFLGEAVRHRLNIVVSGGTSTGKTTFLNALLKEIPPDERLILIEDTPELKVGQANMVGLVAVKSELGEARVTVDDLLQAALRMRPDRIILGELRGPEAYSFLRAVNTGHPGSLTTLHADSPQGAVHQLALIVLQTGTQLRFEDVVHYVENVVDIFVQLERKDGRRNVSEVLFARRP